MCGIAGWVDFQRDVGSSATVGEAMANALIRRGPDAAGLWAGTHALLAHRRLAIVDLAGGAQPMAIRANNQIQIVLSYSGEVYNFREIRSDLQMKGHRFATLSDTEVVLHAYLEWGERFVEHFNGMFAFALWDEREQKLLLVRDRLGIKPLYWAKHGSGLLFGSEAKAILAHPEFSPHINFHGLVDLLSLSRDGAETVFRDIQELPPGSMLVMTRGRAPLVKHYWRLARTELRDSVTESTEQVLDLLTNAVDLQLFADVPLCTLLSGGLDSSILTALAQRITQRQGESSVRSFSIDFVGQKEYFRADTFRPDRDEPFALEASRFIGTRHDTILLDNDVLVHDQTRDAVLQANDMPVTFGDVDASLFLLFKRIREHSTVALSGESADEVFGGYAWFRNHDALSQPRFPWLSKMELLEPRFLNRDFSRSYDLSRHQSLSYRKAISQVEHLPDDSPEERRMREVCHMHLTRWLPILLDRKDRLSMYASLEVRVPFTDHRLVEYVYNLPWCHKSENNEEKSLLKRAAAGLLPDSIFARKKSPYPTSANIAYERCLRGNVQDLVSEPSRKVFQILDRSQLEQELTQQVGYFDTQLKRNNLETAVALDRWLEKYQLTA